MKNYDNLSQLQHHTYHAHTTVQTTPTNKDTLQRETFPDIDLKGHPHNLT